MFGILVLNFEQWLFVFWYHLSGAHSMMYWTRVARKEDDFFFVYCLEVNYPSIANMSRDMISKVYHWWQFQICIRGWLVFVCSCKKCSGHLGSIILRCLCSLAISKIMKVVLRSSLVLISPLMLVHTSNILKHSMMI